MQLASESTRDGTGYFIAFFGFCAYTAYIAYPTYTLLSDDGKHENPSETESRSTAVYRIIGQHVGSTELSHPSRRHNDVSVISFPALSLYIHSTPVSAAQLHR